MAENGCQGIIRQLTTNFICEYFVEQHSFMLVYFSYLCVLCFFFMELGAGFCFLQALSLLLFF